MKLTEFFIKNKSTAFFLFAMLIVGGLLCYQALPKLENPEIPVKAAMITTEFPGASPKEVEALVTDKIEENIREMEQVEKVTTQSQQGLSVVEVTLYQKSQDLSASWRTLRNKVKDAQREFPEGVRDPIVNDEFGDVFGVLLSLKGSNYSYRELEDLSEEIRDALLTLDTVGKVEIKGKQDQRIYVEFSNAVLAEYKTSPAVIADLLANENILMSSGRIQSDEKRLTIEVSGSFKGVEQIGRTALKIPGSEESVSLNDIAKIYRGYIDPPSEKILVDGEDALIVAVNLRKGSNVINMSRDVKKTLTQLRTTLPEDIELDVFYDESLYVDTKINDFLTNLGQSITSVMIVILMFTGLRMGIISSALIPMAVLGTFIVMLVSGLAVETVSLAAFIISLGILVDNGIVMSENILTQLNQGESKLNACLKSSSEMFMPLLAGSLTTICAFLPIPMSEEAIGDFTVSLFVVIASSLGWSWFLSLTLIPLLCYFLLKPKKTEQNFSGKWYTAFRNLLLFNLKRPLAFVAVVMTITGMGAWGMQFVPKLFFPPNDRDMFLIDFWQPYGVDIYTTLNRANRLTRFLEAQPEVTTVSNFVGNGGPRWYLSLTPENPNLSYAFFMVKTKDNASVDAVLPRLKLFLGESFPESRSKVKKLENGPAVGDPIQIRLSGPDIDTLYQVRNKVMASINSVSGVSGLYDNWGEWTQRLKINVNQEKVKRAGLSSSDVAESLQYQLDGITASNYLEEDSVIPITLRAQKAYRNDVGNIEALNVYSSSDASINVPLVQVADVSLNWQPSNVRTRNKQKTLTIKGQVEGRNDVAVVEELSQKLTELSSQASWPQGYSFSFGGLAEEQSKAMGSIMAGVPLAAGLLLLVLLFQYNSFKNVSIILITVLPMLAGISPGLIITNAPFGFMAFLGFISLFGIIVNNAIVLIDRIEIHRAKGLSPSDSIVLATQQRLRPILMTMCTTVIGLLPLSLQGGEMWRPMANTIISGLLVASLVGIVLCPVLYALFHGVRFKDYRYSLDAADAAPTQK
ncbi:MAG: efflux RND transporter permease subunit [Cyanobacteria bacterium P01_H01_bin.74]